jgi:hypothetical protein
MEIDLVREETNELRPDTQEGASQVMAWRREFQTEGGSSKGQRRR